MLFDTKHLRESGAAIKSNFMMSGDGERVFAHVMPGYPKRASCAPVLVETATASKKGAKAAGASTAAQIDAGEEPTGATGWRFAYRLRKPEQEPPSFKGLQLLHEHCCPPGMQLHGRRASADEQSKA